MIDNNELVSVVVPIYKVEKYLKNCIDSILNQTYYNMEIILVDDGSPDNCGKICNEYANKDKRIKVIHKKNGGLSDARNIGIENATGNYITFVDSDDDIEKEYIEYLYNLLKKNNTKMSIATYTIISGKKKINIGHGYKEKKLTTIECLDNMLCENGFSISVCAKLYDIRLFDKIRFPVGKLNEDNGTTYKLILQCDEIAYGNKSIYNYYKRENSIMTSQFEIKKFDLLELTDKMCDEIENIYPVLKDSTDKKRITSRFSILRQMLIGKYEDKNKIEEIEDYILKRKNIILKDSKMSTRDKIALLILLILGKKIFSFSWKIYCKIKY